jgi:hypothetical protein
MHPYYVRVRLEPTYPPQIGRILLRTVGLGKFGLDHPFTQSRREFRTLPLHLTIVATDSVRQPFGTVKIFERLRSVGFGFQRIHVYEM